MSEKVREEGANRRAWRTPEMVLALIALVIAVTGTAIAGAPDSIRSGDIVNGEVKTQDVADDSAPGSLTGPDFAAQTLTGSDFAANSITGSDFNEGFLTGADVLGESLGSADVGSLGTADIQESTLSLVPLATNSGLLDEVDSSELVFGASSTGDSGQDECVGEVSESSYEVCADLVLSLPHAARAFVLGTGTWHMVDTEQTDAAANCRLEVDDSATGSNITAGDDPFVFSPRSAHNFTAVAMPFGGTAVTGTLGAGSHKFELACLSLGSSDVDRQRISVVALGVG